MKNEETILVEIVKASMPECWYTDSIGEVYKAVKVENDERVGYRATHRFFGGILKADAKVVTMAEI